MPTPEPFRWITDRLEQIDRAQLRRSFVTTTFVDGLVIERDGTKLVNFGANDYLGFAAEAAGRRDTRSLYGSGASPLVTGYSHEQAALEEELAAFEWTEAAVVTPTGFAANLAVLTTLAEAGDLILSDQLNHASIIDGCRLSRAERFIYPHRDHQLVEELLQVHRRSFNRAWIVTDGVFSMDGTLAPLRELVEIAERFDATLIVDEAHGTGVLGPQGRGACEACGVEEHVPIRVGTLSKAIGSLGGFVVGPRPVIDYLVTRARTLIYSTALPAGIMALARDGLHRIENEPQRRSRLREHGEYLRLRLEEHGIRTPADPTPIIPIRLGDNGRVLAAHQRLLEAGFFVPAIRSPTVPQGTARLRISLSAAHQRDDLVRLADCLITLLACDDR